MKLIWFGSLCSDGVHWRSESFWKPELWLSCCAGIQRICHVSLVVTWMLHGNNYTCTGFKTSCQHWALTSCWLTANSQLLHAIPKRSVLVVLKTDLRILIQWNQCVNSRARREDLVSWLRCWRCVYLTALTVAAPVSSITPCKTSKLIQCQKMQEITVILFHRCILLSDSFCDNFIDLCFSS